MGDPATPTCPRSRSSRVVKIRCLSEVSHAGRMSGRRRELCNRPTGHSRCARSPLFAAIIGGRPGRTTHPRPPPTSAAAGIRDDQWPNRGLLRWAHPAIDTTCDDEIPSPPSFPAVSMDADRPQVSGGSSTARRSASPQPRRTRSATTSSATAHSQTLPLASACTRPTGRTTVSEHGLDPRLDLRGAHRPTTTGRTCGDRGSPERRDCRQCILFRQRSPARGTVTA